MCEERKWEYNLNKFNTKIGEYYGIPTPNFSSFRDCFEYISGQDRRPIIVIDEFSYLMKNRDIPGEFQGIVDEILPESEIKLILSGSAVSMMKKDLLGSGSPLYGRTTSHLSLQPLKFRDVLIWFKGIDPEDAVKIFGVCDGIPKYLEFFRGKDVGDEIKRNLFNPDGFLFREPKLLLEEELREPATHHQILEAISLGHTRVTDIANYSYMEAKDVVPYITMLIDLGFVRKERSVLSKKRKRGLYRIRDNLFRFWFRFVSPHFAEIESWTKEGAVEGFEEHFNHYLGEVFEDICRQYLLADVGYSTIGSWWHKEDEIDIVALSQNGNNILFGECKWTEKKVDLPILKMLKEKAKKVKWKNEERVENFAIFSKKGFTDRLIQASSDDNRIALYSIDDMYRSIAR